MKFTMRNDCIWMTHRIIRNKEGEIISSDTPKGCSFCGYDIDDWRICLTCQRYQKCSDESDDCPLSKDGACSDNCAFNVGEAGCLLVRSMVRYLDEVE